MGHFSTSRVVFFTCLTLTSSLVVGQDDSRFDPQYEASIRPLISKHCFECHAGDTVEADIDLSSFKTVAQLRRRTKVWQRVDAMLTTRQMPPKDATQPNDAEHKRLSNWVREFLTREARTRAGDPGPVVLRRLSNAEYTYTIRDLTGIDSLDPTHEFPIDGAAGEGFTNTGSGLVMSPSLIQKYLDAARLITEHAALYPDGIRFSPHTTGRDLTDAALADIRDFYGRFTVTGGGSRVNLQGIQFETNQGGILPLDQYLTAAIAARDAIRTGGRSIAEIARERQLSPKYLTTLWTALNDKAPSLLLDPVRKRWQTATVNEVPALVADIATWQSQLWKFNVVGHVGREGSPSAWMESKSGVTERREFRIKLPPSDNGQPIVVSLAAGDARDGNENDFALWRDMRLERAGQTAINLRDVNGLHQRLNELRRELLAQTQSYLNATAEADADTDINAVALQHQLQPDLLNVWLNFLGTSVGGPVKVAGHLDQKLPPGADDFVTSWGLPQTPSVAANSSDREVRIPGISRPHSVTVHPSPSGFVAVGWSSPIDGVVELKAALSDAHPECGNGVEWFLQHRFGRRSQTLWQGDFPTRGSAKMEPKTVSVRKGELISFIVGPRQANHSCDLTAVAFTISETSGDKRIWDLGKDVSPDILAGNPHADRLGNADVWHFYAGPMKELDTGPPATNRVPADSLLARWQTEKDADKRTELAEQVSTLVNGDAPSGNAAKSPDGLLYAALHSLTIPPDAESVVKQVQPDRRFGTHPLGHAIDPNHLVVKAPSTITFQIPAELAEGRELVVAGMYDVDHGREATLQLNVTTGPATTIPPTSPVIAAAETDARRRAEKSFQDFRELFPIALCYTPIVPVDEVVTATLFHREDQMLQKLMLDQQQSDELDRLWDELYYVSEEPLKLVVALEQIREFATQDRQDMVASWDKMKPIVKARADAFEKRVIATQPGHVESLIEIADRIWRRPLTSDEQAEIRRLYQRVRNDELPHEQAIRLVLARLLTSPNFLYHRESPSVGKKASPVGSFELASRLSYFLWSSVPDEPLRTAAREKLVDHPDELTSQTRRMLRDPKVRRMAIHFACQWLHLRDFDQSVEKNEQLYPEFAAIRGEMYEETVRFFEDMMMQDRSILEMFDSDHAILNESLAKFYGIDTVTGPAWRRVDGLKNHGRGGVLGMATVLASQSGASRTSPILRGNWVSETLLGERLPRPPANVPQLPESVPTGLTARELIEQHSSVPACVKCHERIDPFGFTLEQFDTLGRRRAASVDTKSRLPDGQSIEGIEGLKHYLVVTRRRDVVRQFCRKLLGYALGREIQLSDTVLLDSMQQRLQENEYRFSVAVETIVLSKQFREIRGRDFVDEEAD